MHVGINTNSSRRYPIEDPGIVRPPILFIHHPVYCKASQGEIAR